VYVIKNKRASFDGRGGRCTRPVGTLCGSFHNSETRMFEDIAVLHWRTLAAGRQDVPKVIECTRHFCDKFVCIFIFLLYVSIICREYYWYFVVYRRSSSSWVRTQAVSAWILISVTIVDMSQKIQVSSSFIIECTLVSHCVFRYFCTFVSIFEMLYDKLDVLKNSKRLEG